MGVCSSSAKRGAHRNCTTAPLCVSTKPKEDRLSASEENASRPAPIETKDVGILNKMSTAYKNTSGESSDGFDIPEFVHSDVQYSDSVFDETLNHLEQHPFFGTVSNEGSHNLDKGRDSVTTLEHISDRELDLHEHEGRVKQELIPKSASSSPLPTRQKQTHDGHPDRLSSSGHPPERSRRASLNPSLNSSNGLRRSNSTGTLFVDSTVSQPNRDETLSCVALAIYYIILDGHQQEDPQLLQDKFDEQRFPLTEEPVPDSYFVEIPSDEDVYNFMDLLFDAAALSAECGIVTLVYINRCIQYTNIAMHACNWKRILLGAILMASKVWDDQAVWNVDYCSILPNIEVDDMNDIERTFLEMLQFNINVDSSVYTKYYFELRQLAAEADRPFPLEPLSKEHAAKLEASAKHVRDALTGRTMRGAKSFGHQEFMAKAVLP